MSDIEKIPSHFQREKQQEIKVKKHEKLILVRVPADVSLDKLKQLGSDFRMVEPDTRDAGDLSSMQLLFPLDENLAKRKIDGFRVVERNFEIPSAEEEIEKAEALLR